METTPRVKKRIFYFYRRILETHLSFSACKVFEPLQQNAMYEREVEEKSQKWKTLITIRVGMRNHETSAFAFRLQFSKLKILLLIFQ